MELFNAGEENVYLADREFYKSGTIADFEENWDNVGMDYLNQCQQVWKIIPDRFV